MNISMTSCQQLSLLFHSSSSLTFDYDYDYGVNCQRSHQHQRQRQGWLDEGKINSIQ